MTEARRVVITGIGAVTPIGTGVEGFWDGLRAKRSAVGPVTRFDPAPFRTKIAAEVPDFRPQDFLEERRVKRLDRCSQFTLGAARLAIADAALELAKEDRERVGVMMGSALGGVSHAEAQHANYLQGGLRNVDPGLALTVFTGAASCNLAIECGLQGPNSTNGMSCASGAMALGDAFRIIRRGEADVMLAGGAEAPLAPLTFGAFSIIRAMSTRPAELLGLPGGSLRAGSPADVVVIDPDTPWVLDPADLKSQCKNTPFDEARFSGRVVRTIVGGRTVYEHV